jgi:hypothetical protein
MGGVNRRKYSYENGLPVLLEDYDYDEDGNFQLKTYDILYEFGR